MDLTIERRATLAKVSGAGALPYAVPIQPRQRVLDPARAAALTEKGVEPLLARLLAARGVSSVETRLEPSEAMLNCREMAVLLADCVGTEKTVLIVADYDCDGATAGALLVTAFRACGIHCSILIPDRKRDGYGLSPGLVLDEIANIAPRPNYIVTVDNGINSHDGISAANKLGIEVLVTDHHTPGATLPSARLIVNPNQAGCLFPSKGIAGCGVAWYVAKDLARELENRCIQPGYVAADLLTFVAIGTVADVVPLDSNNRLMVAMGLDAIRRGRCTAGLKALALVSGRTLQTLSCIDIGYALAPRLNAAGRLEHMGKGVALLLCQDDGQALQLAQDLDGINDDRQELTRRMTLEAEQAVHETLSSHAIDDELYTITLFNPEWHEGVIGIVAGRLKERLHRPCFVFCQASDGTIKGSGRSIKSLHLRHALEEMSICDPNLMLKFGGHGMAAGVTLPPGGVEAFMTGFDRVAREHLTVNDLAPVMLHDGQVDADSINIAAVRMTGRSVWGNGFEAPVYADSFEVLSARRIGKKRDHLKLVLSRGDLILDAIAFGAGEIVDQLPQKVDAMYELHVTNYGKQESIQAVIAYFFEAGTISRGLIKKAKPRAPRKNPSKTSK